MNTDEPTENLPDRLRNTEFRDRITNLEFEDRLEVFGLAAGVFLIVVGLATVAGTPWTHKASLGASVLQVIGALATAAVGAGLLWLTRTDRQG